mmetsp:Transcript_30269/g.72793  ORF Transcript_30269/g.72793 Transcript_30269/m.72793 type:complete len:231 (+) Transcript_30269:2460-3152(+)
MLAREHGERLVLVPEHLDKHDVPDLEHVRVVHVHEVRGVAPPNAVVVQLRARAARASVAHLPEVVLHVPLQHPVLGQVLEPEQARLLIRGHGAALVLVALAVGGVEPVWLEAVDNGEQLPGPSDRFLLEVRREAPVSKHLEKRVVIHILANVVEVVVLATSADALLRVGGALEGSERALRVDSAHEDRFELIHSGIGEEKGGVVKRNNTGGRPVRVATCSALLLLSLEEL